MSSEGVRQSDRVSFAMSVEASGQDSVGQDFTERVQTLLVSRNGAVLLLKQKIEAGQEIVLRRFEKGEILKQARARVVAEIDKDGEGTLYAVAIEDQGVDLWDIEFPSLEESRQALARMLVECSFCQRREVAYLNELELKSFEARRCFARHCKHCNAPAIFTQAQQEITASNDGASDGARDHEEKVHPRRNKTRVKARVLACIRRRGFQEEVAVCEDLSRGGLSFRSRNQYAKGTRIEVAVPFTPGSGNIFVPVRIVFSQEMPSAGLYRHGAAYIRPTESSS